MGLVGFICSCLLDFELYRVDIGCWGASQFRGCRTYRVLGV